MHHKMYSKSIAAIKNYYQVLQIAHLIDQLITLCKNTTVHIYGTIIKYWEQVCSEIKILEDLDIESVHKIN